jgi:hypothetical protein
LNHIPDGISASVSNAAEISEYITSSLKTVIKRDSI